MKQHMQIAPNVAKCPSGLTGPTVAVAVAGLIFASACGDPDEQPSMASGVFEGDNGLVVEATLSPDPPQVGEVDMEMELSVDGQLPEEVEVDVEPWMPSHDHGSNTDAVVSEEKPGRFVVEDLTFSMAGIWELRVAVDWDGGADEVIWDFEVDE